MQRKRLQQLTDRQLQLMGVLWDKGTATVADVSDALVKERLARKTIATQLSRLEEQKLVTHTTDGREFVYRALITRDQVAQAKVRTVLDLVLGGSLPSLVRHALEAEEVAPGDVQKIEELLRASRKETK